MFAHFDIHFQIPTVYKRKLSEVFPISVKLKENAFSSKQFQQTQNNFNLSTSFISEIQFFLLLNIDHSIMDCIFILQLCYSFYYLTFPKEYTEIMSSITILNHWSDHNIKTHFCETMIVWDIGGEGTTLWLLIGFLSLNINLSYSDFYQR